MPVRDTNDAELRTLIFDHDKVIVKFTKEQCNVCARMARIFKRLSDEPDYQQITFFTMDSSQNPVSSKEVSLTGTPFFATYVNGMLNQCSLLSDKEALVEMLQNLKIATAH